MMNDVTTQWYKKPWGVVVIVALALLVGYGVYASMTQGGESPMENSDTTEENAVVEVNNIEELIPNSRENNEGTFYLMSYRIEGDVIGTIHRREYADTISYTKSEIDCAERKIKTIGFSQKSPEDIMELDAEWYDLVTGTSKDDLARYVCAKG